jgi:hypothetical protein
VNKPTIRAYRWSSAHRTRCKDSWNYRLVRIAFKVTESSRTQFSRGIICEVMECRCGLVVVWIVVSKGNELCRSTLSFTHLRESREAAPTNHPLSMGYHSSFHAHPSASTKYRGLVLTVFMTHVVLIMAPMSSGISRVSAIRTSS